MTKRTDRRNRRALLALAERRPLVATLIGSAALWLAFPPVGLAVLAWIALIPWLALVATPDFSAKRPWLKIWAASLIYWLATLYFIPIPHWALWFGWLALSAYLSLYPLLFVWISRIWVHRFACPLVLAASISFTALEWVRAHFITGFGLVSLAHTQCKWPIVIQICDLFGGYGLTFVMVLVNSLIFSMLIGESSKRKVQYGCLAVGAVAGLLVYGFVRLNDETMDPQYRTMRAIIVQGSVDTIFPADEQEASDYQLKEFQQYRDLHKRALHDAAQAAVATDLIIWPEGTFPLRDYYSETSLAHLPLSVRYTNEQEDFHRMAEFLQTLNASGQDDGRRIPLLVGALSIDHEHAHVYNSAVLINFSGEVIHRYHKMHRVIFGEYVPLENWFPILGRITPIGRGLTPGLKPVAIPAGQLMLAPNICFESTVPHLIRRQVNRLAADDREPDALVNLTDDGWFYGTSVLDHHLACNIFRAVELRKPTLVAANTGLSAHIDGNGRLQAVGPRRQTAILPVIVEKDVRHSFYRTVGDWPATALAILCAFMVACYWLRKNPTRAMP